MTQYVQDILKKTFGKLDKYYIKAVSLITFIFFCKKIVTQLLLLIIIINNDIFNRLIVWDADS